MDAISSLAAAAVAALVPYLAKAGEEFAKEAGKVAASKIGLLYQTLRTRLKNTPATEEALTDLEENPQDEDTQAVLRVQLKKQMKVDPTLVDTLHQLLSEIKQDNTAYSFLTQVYGGNVENIFNIGELKGGITFDDRNGKRKNHH